MSSKPAIGKIGIWSMEMRFGDPAQRGGAAAEIETMGYGALWIPGGVGGDVTGDLDVLLAATSRITIATGILNIWMHEPEDIAAWWLALPEGQQDRVLLGLGVSHGPLIGEAYEKPLAKMRGWVERVTAAGIPASSLCIAALRPKMLALSAEISAGAHPYLVTAGHSAEARTILGPDALLAPEQGVVLETDPTRARELAKGATEHYRRLPNYVNSWLRLGFTAEEIENAAPRLLDALFPWGTPAEVAARVREHHAAGADHVCVQVITGAGLDIDAALPGWRALAAELV